MDRQATIGIFNTPVNFFKDLAHIPLGVVQPADVYGILTRRTDEKFLGKLPLLTRLFFAIVSPDAFDQLSEAYNIIRQKDSFTMSDSLNDSSQTMHALDKLDMASSVSAVLRRFHFIRLLDHRISRENYHKDRRSSRVTGDHKHGYQRLELLTGLADGEE